MTTLYIETSTRLASLAIARDGQVIAAHEWEARQGSAANLTVYLHQLFELSALSPQTIQRVVVSQGPGSFTGLRVGIVTAKTICLALNIPAIALNSLQVAGWPSLSMARDKGCESVWVVADAQRGEFFAMEWHWQHHGWRATPFSIVTRQQIVAALRPNHLVTGPGAGRLSEEITAVAAQLAPPDVWFPRAAQMLPLLDWLGDQAPQAQSAVTLLPEYGRLSAAEEKRLLDC